MKIGRFYLSNGLASPMQIHGATQVNGEEPGREKKEDEAMRSYMAVVVAVVMAAGLVIGTAGAGLADSEGEGYGALEWTNLGSASGNAAVQTGSGEARGPVGAGALPGRSVKSENGRWLNMDVAEQNLSPELRGLSNIQAGP